MRKALCLLAALASLGPALLLSGCGGSAEPWSIDPAIVGIWDMTDLTEDGFQTYFLHKVIVYRADGTWRSDTADGSWSEGGYQTRGGRLNYWIDASDDPGNVGHEYTFGYQVSLGTLTISGHLSGHYYVATFAGM